MIEMSVFEIYKMNFHIGFFFGCWLSTLLFIVWQLFIDIKKKKGDKHE